jgi:hypothetical protein
MFSFFRKVKRARAVAASIGQLIHYLSVGRETGLSPEKLLKGLVNNVFESMMIGDARVVRALVSMTTDTRLLVSLFTTPRDLQMITFDGDEEYFGFSLSCNLPHGAPRISLDPSFSREVTTQARMLYAECRKMPDAVEIKDFLPPAR